MSAYRQILYHIVFRTKGSEKTINLTHSNKLKNYIWGIITNKQYNLFRINCMEDHVYIKNQQEHHKRESFRDEISRLFKEYGIDFEEKWFWEDS